MPFIVPQVTRGAGKFMGLSVMLFANKEKYYLPSAFFEGFKVGTRDAGDILCILSLVLSGADPPPERVSLREGQGLRGGSGDGDVCGGGCVRCAKTTCSSTRPCPITIILLLMPQMCIARKQSGTSTWERDSAISRTRWSWSTTRTTQGTFCQVMLTVVLCMYLYTRTAQSFIGVLHRSNCLMECATKIVNYMCGCQPYFYPGETLRTYCTST